MNNLDCMASRIPRTFINDILLHTNIINLISDRFEIKKQGKNFFGHCPFHKEKTPSFIVNEEKQIFHCFGCGVHGNAIDFLMKYDHLEFVESIQELAISNRLTFPYSDYNNDVTLIEYYKRNKLYKMMENLNIFYQKNLQLCNNKYVKNYLSYRKINQNIINNFAIGYSLPSWVDILNHFGQKKSDQKILIEIGMLIIKDNKIYDRFRNRLMFPIRNKRGQVIGFGGRTLGFNIPKYLNSPETIIFHKRQHLYGLYEVLKKHPKPSRLLVVEGYIDVITLAQFGIDYAISTLGTSTTNEQLSLLFRSTSTIIYCYDGDCAGRNAAWRALKLALPYMHDDRQLYIMFLPNGEDPDSLVQKEGKKSFEDRIKLAIPFYTFLFDSILSQVDLSSRDGKLRLSNLALPLISQIPGKTLRIYMRQELGNKLGILDNNQLEKLISKLFTDKSSSFIKQPIKYTTMRLLIALLIQYPKLVNLIPSLEGLQKTKKTGLSLFIQLVKQCNKYPNLTTGQLLELYRGTRFSKTIESLATWNHMVIDEQIENVFYDSLTNIYNYALNEYLEKLIAKDRVKGLNSKERREFWVLSQALAK